MMTVMGALTTPHARCVGEPRSRRANPAHTHTHPSTERPLPAHCSPSVTDILADGEDPAALVALIYGDLSIAANRHSARLSSRCILAPKNTDVLAINTLIQDAWPGRVWEYTSADEVRPMGVASMGGQWPQ